MSCFIVHFELEIFAIQGQGVLLRLKNIYKINNKFLLKMGPDPTRPDSTRAYFWPAVSKRPTRLRPGYFPTQPEEIFFDPKGKNLKNLMFLGQIFQIQTQTINGWPDPTRVKNFWPGPITSFYTVDIRVLP